VPIANNLQDHIKLCIRGMASSGMLRYVALVRTDVSEELSASFIRVTRMDELGTTLAVTSNRRSEEIPKYQIPQSLLTMD
jgi:hypothetical protein